MRNTKQRRQQIVLLSFLALWGVVQSFVIVPTFPPWSSKCSQAFLRNDDRHMFITNNNKHNNPLQRQKNSSILQSTSINTDTSNLSTSASGFAIKIEGLTCSHDGGTTYQLKDVNYVLPRYAKIGLLGRNGCGKSTFLRILAMMTCSDSPDTAPSYQLEDIKFTGKIEKAKQCRVAYVEQEPPMPSDVTVADALFGIVSSMDVAPTVAQIQKVTSPYEAVKYFKFAEAHASTNPDALTKAASIMDNTGGWAVMTKAEEVATKLRVQHLLNMPLSSISGGERKRVALAAALVKEPDVLLLDECTNHLDLEAIRWLSDLILEQKKMTCLVVTHDRAFLNQVCRDGVLELDRGSMYSYDGTYTNFLEAKESRLALEDAAIQAAKSKYGVELEWMRRQPQARQTKAKARIDAFYKLEKATKPRAVDPSLTVETANGQRRLGNNVLKCKGVSLAFGDRIILDDFTYDFNSGDKIGVVGANGIGKSTFLKVLTGVQPVDKGEVSTGETVVFGVYNQMGLEVDENQRVLEYVKEHVIAGDGSSMAEAPQEAMRLLKKFEFPSDRWNER